MKNTSFRFKFVILGHLILFLDSYSAAQLLGHQNPLELIVKSVLIDYYKIPDSCLTPNNNDAHNNEDTIVTSNCWEIITPANDSCLKHWKRNCAFNLIIYDSLIAHNAGSFIREFCGRFDIADTFGICQNEMNTINDTSIYKSINEYEVNLSIRLIPFSFWAEQVSEPYNHYCCRRSIVLYFTKPIYFFDGSNALVSCSICSGGADSCFRVSYHLEYTFDGWIIRQSKLTAVW